MVAITEGHKFKSKYKIYLVSQLWTSGRLGESDFLENAYMECFILARIYNITSIAFPNIPVSIYQFSQGVGASIVWQVFVNYTVNSHNDDKNQTLKHICFSCNGKEDYAIYTQFYNHYFNKALGYA